MASICQTGWCFKYLPGGLIQVSLVFLFIWCFWLPWRQKGGGSGKEEVGERWSSFIGIWKRWGENRGKYWALKGLGKGCNLKWIRHGLASVQNVPSVHLSIAFIQSLYMCVSTYYLKVFTYSYCTMVQHSTVTAHKTQKRQLYLLMFIFIFCCVFSFESF